MPQNVPIQLRRGTAALWTSTNPVLNAGEQGFETDTRRTKIGDGVTAWTVLTYADAAALAAAAAAQATANAAVPAAQKGAANGVPSLGSDSKIPAAQMSGKLATSDLTDGAALAAAIAAALKSPTSWAASAAGGTPTLTSGTAVPGTAYLNTTPGSTTFTTPIDGIPGVQEGDALICLTAGSYTLMPKDLLTPAQRAAGATVGYLAVDASGVAYRPDGTVLTVTGSSGPSATTFATTWDMASANGKDMGEYSVVGATALTSTDVGSVPGGFAEGVVIADGAHTPTFDGATIATWTNTSGARNRVNLKRVGRSKFWSVSSVVGAIMSIPTAPAIATAPQILVAGVGSAITFLPASGITGYPVPTNLTYDAYVGGTTLLQANITSGSYVIPGGTTGTLTVHAKCSNASGSVEVSSSGATIQSKVTDPGLVVVGDSIPGYGQGLIGAAATWTVARDTNGLVTVVVPAPGHKIFGDQSIFVGNMTDTTLNGMFPFHFVDNNTFQYQTTVTGLPISASSAIVTPAQFVPQSLLYSRYLLSWLQASAKGGFRLYGTYATGGMLARDMGPNMSLALAGASAAWGLILTGGINDIKGGQTTAQTIASVKALITAAVTAGKKVFWTKITPLGTTYVTGSGYSAYNNSHKIVNDAIEAWVDNVNSFVIDSVTPLLNVATNAAYDWATSDSIHWKPQAAKLIGAAAWAVISPMVTTHAMLPTASGGAAGVPWATKARDRGVWTTPTVAGGFQTGGSAATGLGLFADTSALQTAFPAASNSGAYALVGVAGNAQSYRSDGTSWTTGTAYTGSNKVVWGTLPAGMGCGRTAGTGAAVVSTVDLLDGGGLAVQAMISGAAASDKVQIYLDGNNGISMTTAANWIGGVVPAPGTKFKIVCELGWGNYNASNASSIRIVTTSQNSGTYMTSVGGDDPNAGGLGGDSTHTDTGFMEVESGVMTVPLSGTAPTVLVPQVQVSFSAASTTPLQVLARNMVYMAVASDSV